LGLVDGWSDAAHAREADDLSCEGGVMALPDYQQFMLPLLQYLSDGQPRSRQERTEWLANHLQLTEAQRTAS
jgi:hypothetical protein